MKNLLLPLIFLLALSACKEEEAMKNNPEISMYMTCMCALDIETNVRIREPDLGYSNGLPVYEGYSMRILSSDTLRYLEFKALKSSIGPALEIVVLENSDTLFYDRVIDAGDSIYYNYRP